MITVKVVVAGLLTTIPHADGDGATALLRDAWTETQLLPEEPELAEDDLYLHVPLLLLLKGQCEVGCSLDPAVSSPGGSSLNLNQILGLSEGDFVWYPVGRDLSFPQLARAIPGKTTSRRRGSFRLREGWLNTSEVNPVCLTNPASCLAAITRLTVRPGSIYPACYVKDYAAEGRDAAFRMGRVDGNRTGWFKRRIFEHYVIEFNVRADKLELAGDLLTRADVHDDAGMARAVIAPDEGKIVLFLGNIFLDQPAQSGDHLSHYGSLYDLAIEERLPPNKTRVPVYVSGGLPKKTDCACGPIEDLLPVFPDEESRAGGLPIARYPNNPMRCPPASTMDHR